MDISIRLKNPDDRIEIDLSLDEPKSEVARVPQCPLIKEKAITEALKYFTMI